MATARASRTPATSGACPRPTPRSACAPGWARRGASPRSAPLATRNVQESTFAEAPRLAAEDLAGMRSIARNNCASCTIGCEHIYATKKGGGVRVEYENVFALGPLCGVSDPDAVLAASARCD